MGGNSAIALVAAAIYFVPRYLKMGLTTIPEFLEKRFDKTTRLIVAFFLIVSFVITLLPIVLYTGAINLESIFNVSEILGCISKRRFVDNCCNYRCYWFHLRNFWRSKSSCYF